MTHRKKNDTLSAEALRDFLKGQREFLAEVKADPTSYDALGVIRNVKSMIEEMEEFIVEMEERDASKD